MKKKFQITVSGKTKVLVRCKDEDGEKVTREYRDLTWATAQRIDHLTYGKKYAVHAVVTPNSVDVFIRRRGNV